ncbi:hypothetical protein [Ramlibacter humi]|uniref:Carboxypeptidase regulatory-like domain-containing protein n=1 Tax=Ramlibacter humi TaxID=2530451 RepID=A0A4Z0C0E6_9BURK|nr:hypothetical protein [Ramlibacter humi]TFZ04000.1 hypothetical protein EZ216_10200 [Ramlibacter humi]
MKLKVPGLTAATVSVAALVAACGGGDGSSSAAGSSLQLSGVAATGLAMAGGAVDVKCASGTGTATTNDSGGYTVTVANGALPCIVKVTGTVNGTEVTLHSLAQGSGTSATANVTPLTELILARAAGTLPSDLFNNFGSGGAVTGASLTQATTDVLAALSTAAGVDLTTIDPFKTALVPATAANPSGGNTYDKLLDRLGAVVNTAALPQVTSQIASTAGGGSAPVTLNEVVANVSKGTLAGCPQALSGKYRIVDYVGATDVVNIDFGAGVLHAPDGDHAITAGSQACEFDVAGSFPTTVMISPSGAGVTRDAERAGFIFPVQAHTLASLQGKWDYLESGIEEASFSNRARHWVGEMTIAADGGTGVCDYDVMGASFGSCIIDTHESTAFTAQADGSFRLQYGQVGGQVYGFRAPSGDLTLFGTNNPVGSFDAEVLKTNFVLTRPQVAKPSPVGTVSKFWDVVQNVQIDSSGNAVLVSGSPVLSVAVPARNSTTVTASTDAAITRKLTSAGTDNGRVDTLTLNSPIPGLRSRPQGTDTSTGTAISYSAVIIRQLPGVGISVALDMRANAQFMSYTVTRP